MAPCEVLQRQSPTGRASIWHSGSEHHYGSGSTHGRADALLRAILFGAASPAPEATPNGPLIVFGTASLHIFQPYSKNSTGAAPPISGVFGAPIYMLHQNELMRPPQLHGVSCSMEWWSWGVWEGVHSMEPKNVE